MRVTQILLYLNTTKTFIKNINVPYCVNCVHFIEHKTNYPYDSVPDDAKYGQCKLFGKNNIITGEINYDYAYNCRKDNLSCGIDGKFFEKK